MCNIRTIICITLFAAAFSTCLYGNENREDIQEDLTLNTNTIALAKQFYKNDSLKSISMQNCKDVEPYCFSECKNLKNVFLPSCTNVQDAAFMRCKSVENIDLPLCESCGQLSFSGCSSLETLSIPKCTSIEGRSIIHNCHNLKHVDLSSYSNSVPERMFNRVYCLESVDIRKALEVGQVCFSLCTNLQEVYIDGVQTINSFAFAGCKNLERLTSNNTNVIYCETIGVGAFYDCRSLKHINLPYCSTIEQNAFHNCSALETVIAETCVELGREAFRGCTNLKTLNLRNVNELWGSYFFADCPNLVELDLSYGFSLYTISRHIETGNFPWGITNPDCKILCSDGWVDRKGKTHNY